MLTRADFPEPASAQLPTSQGDVMAYYRLDVPLVAQTSSDTCWHASALMVWYYSQKISGRQGPMNTLQADYAANRPINDWPALAKVVGLIEVGRATPYNSADIKDLLVNNGPLWAAGNWYGVGHVVVVTGVDGETVYLNDPDGGVKKTGLLSWFNTKRFSSWPDSLLAKDPNRY
jgi:ABC-type bacteriocin/lantibiotic exporter with double-glycine peptidase domain